MCFLRVFGGNYLICLSWKVHCFIEKVASSSIAGHAEARLYSDGTVEWNSGMVEYWNGGITTPHKAGRPLPTSNRFFAERNWTNAGDNSKWFS